MHAALVRPGRTRGRTGVVLGLALVAAAGVMLLVTTSPIEPVAGPEGDPGVELPGRLAPDDLDAEPSLPATAGGVTSFGCEPAGCALWEARVGDGAYAVADDVIVQATTVGVRALDPMTGRTVWRVAYIDDDLPPLLDAVDVRRLDDEVVVTSDGGLVQVRAVSTGDLRWHRDLDVERITALTGHAGVLVAVGHPRSGERQPPVAVTAIDRTTGASLWEQAVHRAVTIETAPLILQPRTLKVVAVDPRTGEPVWTRDVIGPVRGLVGDGTLALVSPGGVDLIDPRTGELLRTVPRRVTDAGVTRIAGGSLFVDAPSGPDPHAAPRSTMTVVALSDPDRAPWAIPGTTGVLEVEDGSVIVAHDADDLTIQHVGSDGGPRWSRSVRLTDAACCWTVQRGFDDETLLLVPPDPGRQLVEVLSLADGRVIATYSVPSTQVRNTLVWTNGIATESGQEGTVLAGPGGTVHLGSDAEVIATEPVPVVRLPGGLIGIDRSALLPSMEPR